MGFGRTALYDLVHAHFQAEGLKDASQLADDFIRGGRKEVLSVVMEFWNDDDHDYTGEVEDVLDTLTG